MCGDAIMQGALGSGQQARQVFERISPSELSLDADARFKHFTKTLWPALRDRSGEACCSSARRVLQARMSEWHSAFAMKYRSCFGMQLHGPGFPGFCAG